MCPVGPATALNEAPTAAHTVTARERAEDTVEMLKIVFGDERGTRDIFAAGTVIASVLGVGVALGTMIRGLRTDLNQRVDGLDRRIDGIERRIDGLEERIDRLDARMRTLESAQNRLSGLLEGLALTGSLAADRKPAS